MNHFRMTDSNDNGYQNMDESHDDSNIQPHLGSMQLNDPASPEQVNPAFEDDDGLGHVSSQSKTKQF